MTKPERLSKTEEDILVILASSPEPMPAHDIADIMRISVQEVLSVLAKMATSLRIYRNKRFEMSLAINPDTNKNQPLNIPIDERL